MYFSRAFFFSALFFAISVVATAQQNTQFGISTSVGFGEEVNWKLRHHGKLESKANDTYSTTKGLGAFYLYKFSPNISLGLEGRLFWWNTEELDDEDYASSKMVDISPVVRLNKPLASNITGYLKLNPGFSINIPSADLDDDGETWRNSFGYNIAAFLGMEFPISNEIAANIDFGYIYHDTFGKIKVDNNGSVYVFDYEFYGGQFHINLGMVF